MHTVAISVKLLELHWRRPAKKSPKSLSHSENSLFTCAKIEVPIVVCFAICVVFTHPFFNLKGLLLCVLHLLKVVFAFLLCFSMTLFPDSSLRKSTSKRPSLLLLYLSSFFTNKQTNTATPMNGKLHVKWDSTISRAFFMAAWTSSTMIPKPTNCAE
jgi:hypothetical protein